MSKKKNRNRIDKADAIDLFTNGYSMKVDGTIADYQLRITHSSNPGGHWDWYHTSGKVVEKRGSSLTSIDGKYLTAESVAQLITKMRIINHDNRTTTPAHKQ